MGLARIAGRFRISPPPLEQELEAPELRRSKAPSEAPAELRVSLISRSPERATEWRTSYPPRIQSILIDASVTPAGVLEFGCWIRNPRELRFAPLRTLFHRASGTPSRLRLHGGTEALPLSMRTLLASFVASLFVTAILVSSALGGKPTEQPSQDKKASDERTVFVTGSLIPQRIKLKRIGTTTISPIRIIDRQEIDATGRHTTRGVLVADPSVNGAGR